jgi:hypothetical protein
MKKKSKSRFFRLTVPAIRKLRQLLEVEDLAGFMIEPSEQANANWSRVRVGRGCRTWQHVSMPSLTK